MKKGDPKKILENYKFVLNEMSFRNCKGKNLPRINVKEEES